MKIGLKISLLGNVMLAAAVWWLATPRQAPPAFLGATPPDAANRVQDPPPIPAPTEPAATGHFDWRELESSDYPAYVRNLRNIRCPEQTVRDIVTADVAGLFARKRTELQRAGAAEETGRWSRAEETNLVAALLGDTPAHREGLANAPGPQPEGTGSARMPLVFEAQALATLHLSQEQQEAIDELARQFINDIGGLNQDPRDPEYFERWRRAKAKADTMIVGAIGRRALVDLDQALPPTDGEGSE